MMFSRYREMEKACRRHAQLDKTTAKLWLEEAQIWLKLMQVEHRLQSLGGADRRPSAAKSKSLNGQK
jgi:hypothetical protein